MFFRGHTPGSQSGRPVPAMTSMPQPPHRPAFVWVVSTSNTAIVEILIALFKQTIGFSPKTTVRMSGQLGNELFADDVSVASGLPILNQMKRIQNTSPQRPFGSGCLFVAGFHHPGLRNRGVPIWFLNRIWIVPHRLFGHAVAPNN